MKRFSRSLWGIVCTWLLLTLFCFAATSAATLDDYVLKPDSAYGWNELRRTPVPGVGTIHHLSLTSQVWQGITWQHRINLLVPNQIESKTVLLFVTGTGSGQEELQYAGILAKALSAPVAILQDIPNQPLYNGLYEDALIAYTFAKVLETQDLSWPLLLPMTKATVRAMDAIEEYGQSRLGFQPEGFVVTGASKRGWTTWLTAAADTRVRGIAPIVYDNLNLSAQMDHQVAVWGDYSFKIDDYTNLKLPDLLRTDAGKILADIVDPFAYRSRYNLPKLIIAGTNDPYWPVDAVNLYWSDLPGPSWIHYDPNAGHGLANHERVLSTLAGFFLRSTGKLPLQPVEWARTDTGENVRLTVGTAVPFSQVNLWSAASPLRDFRSATWSNRLVLGSEKHTFEVSKPSSGYKAFYAEVVYTLNGLEIALATPMQVIGADD